MHNTNINKYLYKIFLISTKYTPITLAICFIANLVCNYFKIIAPILVYFGGVSFSFLMLLYLISWVFQFCHLYRIPLHYITVGNVIGLCNQWFQYPISSMNMARVYFVITGIAVCIYIWFMYKNRNNPKIDPIKQLCDNYCRC